MSYAIRNSIILFVVLVLLLAGGIFGIKYKYESSIDDLIKKNKEKKLSVEELESVLADYEYYDHELNLSKLKLGYYPKLILPEKLVHNSYRYFDKISTRGAMFDYTFKLVGIKSADNVLYADFQLTGEGKFANIARFLYRLENGKPIYKIESLTVRSKGKNIYDGADLVSVSMKITGMFSGEISETDESVSRIFEEALVFPGMVLKIYQMSESAAPVSHIVQAGESLKSIAKMYLGEESKWKEIFSLNSSTLSDPNKIYVGQVLAVGNSSGVENRVFHKIQPGETLAKIALKYYGTADAWKKIHNANIETVADPGNISLGDSLVIPDMNGPAELQHTVSAGETLGKIAKQYFGDASAWKVIYQLNSEIIADPNNIPRGIQLRISKSESKPSYLIHEVDPGETLRDIAASYLDDEDKWRQIYYWNKSTIDGRTDGDVIPQFDPFKPLISSTLPPNSAGRLDVSRSKLLALTKDKAFILNQKGQMIEISAGDRVYLGNLSRIDLDSGKVYFRLNKGGIRETVVLRLNDSQRGKK